MIEDIVNVVQDINPIAELNDTAKQSRHRNEEKETPFFGNLERDLCHQERYKPKRDEKKRPDDWIVEVLCQVSSCPREHTTRESHTILKEETRTIPPVSVLHEVHRVGIPRIKEVPSHQDEEKSE